MNNHKRMMLILAVSIGLTLNPSATQSATTTTGGVVNKQVKRHTVVVPTLNSYSGIKRQLHPAELKQMLNLVGFKGKKLEEAWSIAMRESRGIPTAHNGNRNTGDNSYGLFQINMIGDLGPDRRKKFGLNSNKQLFNPVVNAKIAFHMSNGGKDWSAWHGMNPDAKKWLKHFPD